MKQRGNGFYSLRFQILERDQFTCRYCGQCAPNVMLEVDHVIPVCEGGDDDPSNLITSCTACNRGKEGLRKRTIPPLQRIQSRTTMAGKIITALSDGALTALELRRATGAADEVLRTRLHKLRVRKIVGVTSGERPMKFFLNNQP